MNKKLFIGITILLVLVSCIFLFFSNSFNKKKEGFIQPDPDTGKYDIEEINKKAVIPLDIYQTWHTKDLPPKMRECVEKLKKANPEFTHHLYDDNDCREFIKNNFDSDVLEAFDDLIPGTFKGDLWRYCILYKKGGIYLDIKYEVVDNFKLIELVDKEYFIKEYKEYRKGWKFYNNNPEYDENIIYTGLLILKPNNKKLFEIIKNICDNVKNKYYGYRATCPTGPTLFRNICNDIEFNNIQFVYFEPIKEGYIKNINTNKIILKHYNEYREEQKIYQKTPYWQDLWAERKIYK